MNSVSVNLYVYHSNNAYLYNFGLMWVVLIKKCVNLTHFPLYTL